MTGLIPKLSLHNRLELPCDWEDWDGQEVKSRYAKSLFPAWSVWAFWNQFDQADSGDARAEPSSIEATQEISGSGVNEEWALWSNEIYHELVTTLDNVMGGIADESADLAAAPPMHTVSDDE